MEAQRTYRKAERHTGNHSSAARESSRCHARLAVGILADHLSTQVKLQGDLTKLCARNAVKREVRFRRHVQVLKRVRPGRAVPLVAL